MGEIAINGPTLGGGNEWAPILWGLPAWFGIESATRHYIEAMFAVGKGIGARRTL